MILLSALFALSAFAADPYQPQSAPAVYTPYASAPPMPSLSASELAKLEAGQSVRQQFQDGSAGGGLAVQDIHADPSVIWSRILDFPAYPRMVSNMKTCEVVSVRGEHTFVHFIIGAMMIEAEYWIDHTVRTDLGWITWTLDRSRTSDLDDTVGFWRVEALPSRPGWSRVSYSVSVKAAGSVPDVVVDLLTSSGLTRATSWVKRESERAAGTAP